MILVSTQTFPPRIGGMETLMYSLCTSLHSGGENLIVFADRLQCPSDSDHVFDRGLPFEVIRYAGFKPFRRFFKARDTAKFALRKINPGAKLITDSWKSLEYIDCRSFTRVICLAHGSELSGQLSSYKRKRIHNAYMKANYIVANSAYTASQATDFVHDPDKIRIIYPGITLPETCPDIDQKIKLEFFGYKPVLITVARLDQRKGQDRIISIMPTLLQRFPGLHYVIVGTGPEREQLEKQARESGVYCNVTFKGTLTGPEKSACLQHSDLFVMPGSIVGSNVEGFGMAYIEAAYFGLPSVACNSGGAAEAVLHNQTGLVCEPGELQQLVDNIVRILSDDRLRKRLGSNAQIRSREFLWDTKITEYNALLSP